MFQVEPHSQLRKFRTESMADDALIERIARSIVTAGSTGPSVHPKLISAPGKQFVLSRAILIDVGAVSVVAQSKPSMSSGGARQSSSTWQQLHRSPRPEMFVCHQLKVSMPFQ